jgi:uncharacterized membrane protein
MLSRKNTFILMQVVLCAALTLALILFGNQLFEHEISIMGIGGAIAMFTVFGLIKVWITESKMKKLTPQQSINFYLILKVGRIFLSLAFIAVYALSVKVELKRFFIVFLVVYFIYLLVNTFYLARKS